MVNTALAKARIDSQGLTGQMSHAGSPLTPRDVVDIFGAMQGQDLPGAVASIALRTGGGAPEVIDAFNRGEIVRGYPMRGTVFVQTAEDARWTSELCNASEVRAARKRSPQLGLEDHHFLTARKVLEKTALDGVSRKALFQSWNEQGVSPEHGRGYHVLKHLLATGVASYGTWNGKDNNVHLAEHWLPRGSSLAEKFNGDTIAATAELMRRYFSSRGPATIRDMAWWSKLPLRMLNAALPQLHDLERGQVFGLAETAYWNPEATHILTQPSKHASDARLLPAFDEVILGYPDRMYIVPKQHHESLVPGNNGVFRSSAIAGGKVIGFWKRGGSSGRRKLILEPFETISAARRKKLEHAFENFPFVR